MLLFRCFQLTEIGDSSRKADPIKLNGVRLWPVNKSF